MNRFLGWLLLWVFLISIVGPFAWVLMTSFKSGANILASPWSLPTDLSQGSKNFSVAWGEGGFAKNFVTSLVVTIGTLVILIPVGSMAAYVLAKYPFKGSKFILGGFMGGLMFPNFLVIVPLFLLVDKLGLLNTKIGLILVYVAYSLAFTVFVLHGFFQALPGELMEAARLDGCSDNATFWKVMLPLAKPGVLVVAIFNLIGLWNEYPLALVLANTPDFTTLPVGVANLTENQQYAGDWGALFAGIVIVMIPVMVVYLIFRDQIQKTMLAGALKG
jgi:N-acetylglucosamine transport system permease protein